MAKASARGRTKVFQMEKFSKVSSDSHGSCEVFWVLRLMSDGVILETLRFGKRLASHWRIQGKLHADKTPEHWRASLLEKGWSETK